MHWAPTTRFALLLTVAIVLLFTRVGGAHLHMCFDGKEAPATMHLEDVGIHHAESGANQSHHDVDVTASGGMLGKLSLEVLGVLCAVLFLGPLFAAARRLVPISYPLVRTALPHFLRPPLRGPPSPRFA